MTVKDDQIKAAEKKGFAAGRKLGYLEGVRDGLRQQFTNVLNTSMALSNHLASLLQAILEDEKRHENKVEASAKRAGVKARKPMDLPEPPQVEHVGDEEPGEEREPSDGGS